MVNENELQPFLKALASEKRQEIMFLFKTHNELTVNKIAELANIGQSTASEHLAHLKRAGILLSKKDGKEVIYYPDQTKILSLVDQFKSFLMNCCKE